jgi:aminoglycoside 2''-phosphotransferase
MNLMQNMPIDLPNPLEFTQSIQQIYPQLEIHSIVAQDGQTNDVFIIDDQWVFRFPKIASGVALLRREIALLNHIAAYITLPIPSPLFVNLEIDSTAKAFVGYPMLPGKSLWLEEFRAIDDPNGLKRMAYQLGTFLRELHTIPLASLQPFNLPLTDQLTEWHELYQQIQSSLFPSMRADAQKQVAAHFESYFVDTKLHHFEAALRHGDFGTGNVLYDPATLTISGIIDFSATSIGDPAIDLAGLLNYGEDFCRHCYTVYPELELMLARVQFYQGTFALQEALLGLETEDMDTFMSGIQKYQ